MFDADIRELVNQQPSHTPVAKDYIAARITELVEERPSLFCASKDDTGASDGRDRDLATGYAF